MSVTKRLATICLDKTTVPVASLEALMIGAAAVPSGWERCGFSGRGERIRTSDFYVPNVARYQTAPHPEVVNLCVLRRNRLVPTWHRGRRTQG